MVDEEYKDSEENDEDEEDQDDEDEATDAAEDEDEEDEDADDEFEDEETAREIVVPGEVLTEDVENYIPGRGTVLTKDKKRIISLLIGLQQIKKNYINVIPLKGLYTPQPGDKVIAIVIDKNPVKYKLDINAKDEAQLRPKNTIKRDRGGRGRRYSRDDMNTNKFDIGDILVVKVLSADRLNRPEVTTVGKYLGKKNGGLVISIDPPKIPRVIGRNGSMIKMLKSLTNTNIFVTQNGRIWIRGDNFELEQILIDAIRKIEKEAHTTGLTDRVQAFIENEKQKRGL